jgi:hypothetical protein
MTRTVPGRGVVTMWHYIIGPLRASSSDRCAPPHRTAARLLIGPLRASSSDRCALPACWSTTIAPLVTVRLTSTDERSDESRAPLFGKNGARPHLRSPWLRPDNQAPRSASPRVRPRFGRGEYPPHRVISSSDRFPPIRRITATIKAGSTLAPEPAVERSDECKAPHVAAWHSSDGLSRCRLATVGARFIVAVGRAEAKSHPMKRAWLPGIHRMG